MSNWMNDAAAVQNHNGAGFNPLSDPNMGATMLDPSAFMQNNTAFDQSQFQNQQLQQRMQNGNMRNSSSPAFNNPVYQTNPVVPSKRPRPQEEGLGASPHQNPGMLPNSRSQTPQQSPYPGYQANNHAPQSTPYSHLQHNGSANASPSPIMANQLRPGAQPQRVSTASPHPFSPAAQQFPQHSSPSHSDHGGRVDTPQNNPYMQNPNFVPGGFGQNFTPPPGRTSAPPNAMPTPQMPPNAMHQQQQQQQQPQMYSQQPPPPTQQQQQQQQRPQSSLEQQKLMYQMRLQQQMHQSNLMAAQRIQNMPQTMNPVSKAQMQAANGQLPRGMRTQQQQQHPQQHQQSPPPQQQPQPQQHQQQQSSSVRGPSNPEAFMKNLSHFMQSRGIPLDVNPVAGDRVINLVGLYITVQKFGSYKKVTEQNQWVQVAHALQLNPMQNQSAPAQLKGHYERNLLMFEEALASQQRQKYQQSQAAQMGQQGQPQMSPKQMSNVNQTQQSPQYMQDPQQQQAQQRAMAQQQMQQQQPHQQQQQQQAQPQIQHLQHLQQQQQHQHQQQPPTMPNQQQHSQMTPAKQMQNTRQPSVNGFATPQPTQVSSQQTPGPQGRSRNNAPQSIDVTPTQNGAPFPIPSPASAGKHSNVTMQSPRPDLDAKPQGPEVFELDAEYIPRMREIDSWGGIHPQWLERLGQDIISNKPNVPSIYELGVVDIHALTMSIASGIHAEVRMALDTLATVTNEIRPNVFNLRECDDLVETLIDCAEDQLELLAENTVEVSDDILISSYEDVVRGCRAEAETVPDVPAFASLEYDLDRSVDRLICITTILRNLSFFENNHPLLADEVVIRFLCVVIRYLGTRNMLLRSHINTLDFMKDVIIFLSNLAQAIELPGREQALCLLHFLLAFAPGPQPNMTGSDRIMFASFDPAIHRYLPPAVDSLAKLLARDEPNRSFYKTIYAADVASSPPYDLLTRTFGLAISPIPDRKLETKIGNLQLIIEARKPYLMQGMLAADIVSSLVPGYESNVARAWLTSEDGFAQGLNRLIIFLCSEHYAQAALPRGQARPMDDESLNHITLGAISVLRRLVEKSHNQDEPDSEVSESLPLSENVFKLLEVRHSKPESNREVLKQLCAYAFPVS